MNLKLRRKLENKEERGNKNINLRSLKIVLSNDISKGFQIDFLGMTFCNKQALKKPEVSP